MGVRGVSDGSETGAGSLFNYFYFFRLRACLRWTGGLRDRYILGDLRVTGTSAGRFVGGIPGGAYGVCHRALRIRSSRRKICENNRVVHILGLWTVPREVTLPKAGGLP